MALPSRFSVSSSCTQSVELLGRGISPSQGQYLHTKQHKHRITHTDIHALSVIRTHNPSVRASEDNSCLRPRGHCDRRSEGIRPPLWPRWIWVVSYTPRSKSLRYPLCRRLVRPQNRSGHCGVKKMFLPLSGIKTGQSSPQPVAIADWVIPASSQWPRYDTKLNDMFSVFTVFS
jgi:hypothetical protein